MGSNHRARRSGAALAGVALTAVLAAGCGIRTTSVPVDAGAAPSRVPCSLPAEDVSAQAHQGIPVQIYLVCSSQLATVDRTVRTDETAADRIRVAQVLLEELQRRPSADERQAGFSTAVPEKLRIGAARVDDPRGTLRLNDQPEDLSAEALAQIVCTYAESTTLAPGGTVVLGGPGKYPARGYLCTSETKTRPQTAALPTRTDPGPDTDSDSETGTGTGTEMGTGG
ncbi:GerMN domain-containing protein [Streptomyces sp. NPDC052042]|uniref:GerMN domain-containing protein n=1 Tax=Streptomyces sp. NPDC052042 TaxID=3365683 RepID=UPI0037CE661A